jgi:hypothetical protein
MGRGETVTFKEKPRNNKPLGYNEHTVFSMSHFECYAEWAECDGEECIMVSVYFDGLGESYMSRTFPVDTTLGEIKSGMAIFILKGLQKVQAKVIDFWAKHVR